MKVIQNELTPEIFLKIYTSVGWEPPCMGQVKTALTLTLRQDIKFDGDRINEPGHFALRFDRMNMTDSETMVLQESDVLHVSWQIEKGVVNIAIGQKNEEVVYQANDRSAGDKADFYVEIPKAGSYTITVSAQGAKGEIDFSRIGSE